MPGGSITMFLGGVKAGDPVALQRLWERYFEKVVRLARNKLGESPRRAADEEDVALSAFDSFLRGAGRGRFPRLDDRDDLWRLLVVITARKAADQVNHEGRLKRGGGLVVGEGGCDDEEGLLGMALSREPGPEAAAEMASECRRMLGLLPEPELRRLAVLKMEGFTNEEAADQLGCARATVQRMLKLIQQVWDAGGPAMTPDSGEAAWRAHGVCKRFEAAWRAGQKPEVRPYLGEVPQAERAALFDDLLALDLELRTTAGERPDESDYRRALPEHGAAVARAFQAAGLVRHVTGTFRTGAARPTAVPPRAVGGYEMGEELGRGGMGVVYKAWQPGLKRHVALKVIRAGEHAGAEDVARFRAEAEAVARLSHPNIVQVFEVGEHDGRPFMSLEYVEGGSLDRRLAGTPQALRASAELVVSLARAVHAAHLKGVIHRDLKPANILLGRKEYVGDADASAAPCALSCVVPKVTDFGLAKLVGGSAATRTGSVLGSPSYMAPEQIEARFGPVGPAADVWALGAILYECLTGRPPVKAEGPMETMLQVVAEEPVAPSRLRPRLPRDLETICLKCLSKEQSRRYGSADELANDLGRWLAGEPVRARPVGAAARAVRWAARHPALAGLSAATAALVAVAFGLALVGRHQALADATAKDLLSRGLRTRSDELSDSLRENRRASADLAIDQGTSLCRNGETGRGLEGFARGLGLARLAGDEALERAARYNLGAWAKSHVRLRAVCKTNEWCNAAVFSPDEKTLLTCGTDGVVRLWDAASGAPLGDPIWCEHEVWSVAFGPNGTAALGTGPNGGEWGSVQVWDLRTRQRLKTLHFPRHVHHVSFHPKGGGTLLAACSDHARLFSAASYEPVSGPMRLTEPLGGAQQTHVAAFSPDGEQVVTAGTVHSLFGPPAGEVRLWGGDGSPRRKLAGHRGLVAAAAFSPNGAFLVTGGADGLSRVWDTSSGKPVGVPHSHPGPVEAVAFSPDGATVATGCAVYVWTFQSGPQLIAGGGQARLWDARSGRPLGAPLAHPQPARVVAFSPAGRWLLTGSTDGHTRLFSAATGEMFGGRMLGSGNVQSARFSFDGRLLLTANNGNSARLWELPPEGKAGQGLRVEGHVLSVEYSDDGGRLLTSSNRGRVELWGLPGRESLGQWLHGEDLPWGAAFRPDGGILSFGASALVPHPDDEPRRPFVAAGAAEMECGALSPDRRRVFVTGPDRAGVWPTGGGGPPTWVPSLRGRLRCAIWDPDGAAVFVTTEDGRVERRAFTGEVLPYPVRAGGRVLAVCPKRRGLLTVGDQRGLVLRWDLEGRPLPGPPLSHDGHEVYGAAFSRDGLLAVTCGIDGTARLWEAQTGKPVGPPVALPGRGHSAAFRPDGRQIAVGGQDLVDIIDVPEPVGGDPDEVRAWAEKRTAPAANENGPPS